MSGFNARTPTDVLLDTGVLSVDGVVVGVSRGGLTFSPGITMREVEYDERTAPVAELDRIRFRRPTISGTMLQAGPEDLRLFDPGASGSSNTVTLKAQNVMFAAGDYLEDVELTFDRAGGGTFTVRFPLAICITYEIVGQNESEAEISVTIEARQDRVGGADGDVPFEYEITDPS